MNRSAWGLAKIFFGVFWRRLNMNPTVGFPLL